TPSVIFCTSLMLVPILRMRQRASSIFRGENIVMIGMIYWLFAETIQGRKLDYDILSENVINVFTACGIFAAAVWLGAAGKGVVPPKMLIRVSSLSMSDAALFRVLIITFLLGIFYYAYSCSFSPISMIQGLGQSRFAASWSRGRLGDATALIEQ